jgi:hypothetical protein
MVEAPPHLSLSSTDETEPTGNSQADKLLMAFPAKRITSALFSH